MPRAAAFSTPSVHATVQCKLQRVADCRLRRRARVSGLQPGNYKTVLRLKLNQSSKEGGSNSTSTVNSEICTIELPIYKSDCSGMTGPAVDVGK